MRLYLNFLLLFIGLFFLPLPICTFLICVALESYKPGNDSNSSTCSSLVSLLATLHSSHLEQNLKMRQLHTHIRRATPWNFHWECIKWPQLAENNLQKLSTCRVEIFIHLFSALLCCQFLIYISYKQQLEVAWSGNIYPSNYYSYLI